MHDAASIAAAVTPSSVVLSALGVTSKKKAGTLTAGACAVVAAHPARIVWLGAVGTVLHSGPFSGKADDPGTRAVPLPAAGRRFFPPSTPRSTVARLMLEAAEGPAHPGLLIVPAPK